MVINNKFSIGQLVYLVHDPLQTQRMVKSLIVGKYDITYELISGLEESINYDFEISEEKTIY